MESSEASRLGRHQGQYFNKKSLSGRISITVATFYGGIIIIAVLVTAVITLSILLAAQKPNLIFENPVYTACPEAWIGFKNKCYYFSEDTRNWTFSVFFCATLETILVQIENMEELDFLKRYIGPFDHWIGSNSNFLNHSEKWTAKTSCPAPHFAKGVGKCPYLSDSGVSLGRIYIDRKWICSKPKRNVYKSQITLNSSSEFHV